MQNKTFIDALAATFAGKRNLQDTLFVFPSHRAGTFFRRAMLRLGGPEDLHTATVDDLLNNISKRKQASRLEALAVLYDCWEKLSPENSETFDTFLSWGDALLSDLDEIETAGINLQPVPENLSDYLSSLGTEASARLRQSIFADGVEKTPQHGIAELWSKLVRLQPLFRQALAMRGEGTPGMIQGVAAAVAQNTPSFVSVLPRYQKVVLCGLGRLSPCEKTVLARLREEGRAEFFWDWDGKAVTDPDGPAAGFMRENLRMFPQKQALGCPAFDPADQEWAVVHVPSATAQADVVAEEIESALLCGAEADDIAVVLSDPSLLQPVLDAIPETVRKINVTMGQPLAGGAAASLVDRLEALQRTRRGAGAAASFHYAEVLAVAAHPYVRAALEGCEDVAAKIRGGGRAFVSASIVAADNPVLEKIFVPADGDAVPVWLRSVFETLAPALGQLDREYAALYHKMIGELGDVAPKGLSTASWMRLIRRAAAAESLPFEGEPLQGLQVMGLLETRCLDFGTVIHAGASEGMLPSPGGRTSLLPQGLRAILGLPSAASREGIMAYHFWRGACRARRVVLVHDCRTDGMQGGEETRYAKQLRHLYGVLPREETMSTAVDPAALQAPDLAVRKDAAVMSLLKEKFTDGRGVFSASSLNTYLLCRLRYWREHVLGVREEDDLVESPDAALLGTIFHRVMENIYRPLKNETLDARAVESLRDAGRLEALASSAFLEAGIQEIEGANQVLRDVVVRLADKALETDAALAPLTVLGTEESLGKTVVLPRAGVSVRLYGKADRLDRTGDGILRVVDYKSGSVKGKDDVRDAARTMDRSLGMRRPSIGFQLLFYALLAEGKADGAAPCVYSTRGLFESAPKAVKVDPATLDAFRDGVTGILEEIFDPEVPFDVTDDEEKCGFCPFKKICNRD